MNSPRGWITSAVPSQLLPTKITERVVALRGRGSGGSATALAGAAQRGDERDRDRAISLRDGELRRIQTQETIAALRRRLPVANRIAP